MLTVVAVAGCSRAPSPNVGPSPAGAAPNAHPAESVVAAVDTAAVTDTIPRAGKDATRKDTAHVTISEVSKRAAEVFGDSAAHVPPAILQGSTADSASHFDEPSWDIDVRSYETTTRVEHYLRMFSGSAKERISARLEEGS